MSRPVLLLDTFSLLFRAHHALPPMNTASGEPTSALYGFSSLLLKLLRERRGVALAFALDTKQPTFRHEAYADYKAERVRPEDGLQQQIGRLGELFSALGAPVFAAPGFEADDVLATLCRELREQGDAGTVVSGDRDLLQVARGSIRVLFVGQRGKDAVLYDEQAVQQRFLVPVQRLPSYVALIGDPSDNLPGVPGIGPRSAARLIAGVQSVTELFSAIDRVRPERLRVALEQHREQILRNERLVRLREDVPLPPGPRNAVPTPEQLRALREFFESLEMKSLLARVDALI